MTYEDTNISVITNKNNLTKVSIIGSMLISNNILSDIFNILKKENITIENISLSETCISLIVLTEDSKKLIDTLNKNI